MGYSRSQFRELKAEFDTALLDADGDPRSCRLYDVEMVEGDFKESDDLAAVLHQLHIPEACNIAAVISSVQRLLSLPRSEVACRELSEVLITSLDMLRENIRDAVGHAAGYQETDADRVIRRWAGFLKHPRQYVFAHRCFDGSELGDLDRIEIDTEFLTSWDQLNARERDRKKAELARKFTVAKLPAVSELTNFFVSCAGHLDLLIQTGRHRCC
ncbi:hypothetical protein [Bosea rubneri]|uniref:Uncharacterized protein n=1 Tax=Bosea rubneri TaxID=3075434 RepID=A0ABU3SEH2_9HYPH|nr:hypothetical protein [Bosea sp. ZW T0_25]MDU0343188.1 hypothetical protein [Bosea sp. ZW T0_25]